MKEKLKTSTQFSRGIEVTGSALIENNEGEILMVLSPKWVNKWILPGGHIETGETIVEGIVREGEEETGLTLEGVGTFHMGELIGSHDFYRPAHFIYYDVYCKIVKGKVKLDGVELTSYKWLAPKEALKLDLAETYRGVIQKFIAYKKTFKPRISHPK